MKKTLRPSAAPVSMSTASGRVGGRGGGGRALLGVVGLLGVAGGVGCSDETSSGTGGTTTTVTGGETTTTTGPKVEYLACRKVAVPGACGAGGGEGAALLSFDPGGRGEALAEKSSRIDRVFGALVTVTTGLNTELTVSSVEGRDAVAAFVAGEGFDFEGVTGMKVEEAVSGWSKVAGAYGGAGVAADAFRYGVIRAEGPCELLPQAREAVVADLEALHRATAITGAKGAIARGFARKDVAGVGQSVTTVPLFDESGNPLPEEKTNGTWREDASGGDYPEYVWEDSCSVDQLVGWALGFGAVWEVIADDPDFDAGLKKRLQGDAAAIARSLMEVRESGYDLEIRDGDGRRTYHGILNENGIDKFYLDGAENGFNAMVALGIVGALAFVAEESDIFEYVETQLLSGRELPRIAKENLIGVDLGPGSNFSNYNMAFDGGFLAHRYLCNEGARATLQEAIATSLYDRGKERQPSEQKQTFFDFVYAASAAGGTAYGGMEGAPDGAAIGRGVDTLVGYPEAPFWDEERVNCDEGELASGTCVTVAGETIELLGAVGWNDEVVAKAPVPIEVRPPSNYFWRSNPYQVNGGGDATRLLPAVDYRLAYWMGRWVR